MKKLFKKRELASCNTIEQGKKRVSLAKLFFTFTRIGAFTFGGGHAMLPLIQRDIVEKQHWVSEEDFIDLFAVAQSLPGVFAVNLSMFLGHKLRGVKGAVISALGSTLPSFLIILTLALFFEQAKSNPWVEAIMKGIRPAVVAMIAIPILAIWRALKLKRVLFLIPIAVAIAVWYFSFSPIWIILIAGALGIVHFYLKMHRFVLLRKRK